LGGKPHPRTFGTFPRVLGEYVRERGLLSLPEAIRRMTSLAAETFAIGDRGRIAEGFAADLVLFDAANVADDLDYRDPVRPPKGIRFVMQAGRIVCENGRYVGGRHGVRLTPAHAPRS
jgi:dihydroorotase/N-acyl-D-amino-acid deacylase